ncbi:MAG: dodecin family protein [Myxococcota bacterium]
MAIASVSKITSASPHGWQEAAELDSERAHQTLRNITGLKRIEEKARVEGDEIVEFLVTQQVIFLLAESEEA